MTSYTGRATPLDWTYYCEISKMSVERGVYEILLQSLEADPEFDPQQPVSTPLLIRLIASWNDSPVLFAKISVSIILEHGIISAAYQGPEGRVPVFIRQSGERWEGFDHVSATSSIPTELISSNSESEGGRLCRKLKSLVGTDNLATDPNAAETTVEAMADNLRNISAIKRLAITNLSDAIDLLGVSHKQTFQPVVDSLCSDLHKSMYDELKALDRINSAKTCEDKETASAKLHGHIKHGNEDEAAKQKGGEDAEQRKREENEAAAAAYAAQDRYDSCSDSD